MARYIIGILIVAGLGYWGYASWQDHVESEQKRIAREAKRDVLRAAIAEMASKANAVTDWAKSLAGDNKTRNSPVLTAELQKHWVIERPILFIGNIEDIAINQDGTYQVIVEHNWIGTRYMFLRNSIRVALNCSESIATPLIQAVKAKRKSQLGADTAIVGRIERITTTSQKDSEGDTVTVLTGVGRCINAIYLDERISL